MVCDLGKRVKSLREMRGFSQSQLAKQTGIKQPTLSRLEGGIAKEMRSDAVARLASALGVTSDFLLGKTDKIRAEDVLRDDPQAKTLLQSYLEMSLESKRMLVTYSAYLVQTEMKGLKDKKG